MVDTWVSRPVEVEAVQFTGDNAEEIIQWMGEDTTNSTSIGCLVDFGSVDLAPNWKVWDYLHSTWISLSIGDWIIKGLKGEFYPCADDVFKAKYEAPIQLVHDEPSPLLIGVPDKDDIIDCPCPDCATPGIPEGHTRWAIDMRENGTVRVDVPGTELRTGPQMFWDTRISGVTFWCFKDISGVEFMLNAEKIIAIRKEGEGPLCDEPNVEV